MQTVTLTAKLNIYPTDEQIQQLKKSMDAYTRACDWISQKAFEIEIMMNAYDLHKKLYQDIRKNFGLKSQMAITAIRTVTAKYKTVNSQLKTLPWTYNNEETGDKFYFKRDVYWLQNPIRFKAPCLELQRTRDWCFKNNGTVSLNTLFGRIAVPYTSKGFEKYFTDEYTLGTGKVIKSSNNCWYFYVSVTQKIAEPDHYNRVVGIDRGLNNIISFYDSDGYSENISGSDIQRVRGKYQRTRASLQKKQTKGAKRTLRRISGRENRYINDVNHCLTKTLVRKYGSNTLFVLEDLTDIRSSSNKGKTLNNELNSWAFYDLECKLKYKATCSGSTVIKVESAYTSQRCPICGNISKASRDRSKHLYTCKACGYTENDDVIAAMNLKELGDQWIKGVASPSFGR